MNTSMEELIKKRQNLIEAHKKNNFTNGIRTLLTDLYPDTAHFIYELLQNAEDMNATTVRFILSGDGIEFEHNGTKRDFNLKDIDAITSIGNNAQKKDDATSIGKFGVGFKAVFTYTQSPEVHSGKYHFRIKDYFVPEVKNIKPLSTIDSSGISWTRFYLPFDNPKKPVDIAVSEIQTSLMKLNYSCVLFLKHIKMVEYLMPDGSLGYISCEEDEEHFLTIKCKKHNECLESESRWLRFQKPTNISDEDGKLKDLTIAVAFALEKDKNSNMLKVVPIKDSKTFIYFPAEKEQAGLRFNINAPFASTVARDSVRDCKENEKLIKEVAKLVSDSLEKIKAYGLLTVSFFAVLPNYKDNLSLFYQYIFDYIYNAFYRFDYLPAKGGKYINAKDAIIGPTDISNLFDNKIIYELTGNKKVWAINARLKNSPEDFFINSLYIDKFSYKEIIDIFQLKKLVILEEYVASQSDDWLKKFYNMLYNAYKNLEDDSLEQLKTSKIIRSTSNKMLSANEIYILPVGEKLITKETPIVKTEFWLKKDKKSTLEINISRFFENILKIKRYGPKIEIEKAIQKIVESDKADEYYYEKLLEFANYAEKYKDIEFKQYKLFLYQDNGRLVREKAMKLVFGSAYGSNGDEEIAELYNLNCLYSGYKKHYSDKELDKFIKFAKGQGIFDGLKIIKCTADKHPLFFKELYSNRRSTDYGVSEDYIIYGLVKLLESESESINKLIWKLLDKNGNMNYCRYTTAIYRANASADANMCDSSLIYYLKKYPWIPDKKNVLHKPSEISRHNLRSDFRYNDNNELFKALKIGAAVKEKDNRIKKLEEEANAEGYVLVTKKRYKELEGIGADKKSKKTSFVSDNPNELLKRQTKSKKINEFDDDFSSDGAVNNLQRRTENIEVTFRNSRQMKPQERKFFSKVCESTKEERNVLKNWYQGKCQMCNTSIIGYNLVPHFIAKNIINTQNISETIKKSMFMGWNSLCLCPNCAAKYSVCSRDIRGLRNQIIDTEVIEGDSERIVLTIVLDGKIQEIHYAPKHFLALREVFKLLEKKLHI